MQLDEGHSCSRGEHNGNEQDAVNCAAVCKGTADQCAEKTPDAKENGVHPHDRAAVLGVYLGDVSEIGKGGRHRSAENKESKERERKVERDYRRG